MTKAVTYTEVTSTNHRPRFPSSPQAKRVLKLLKRGHLTRLTAMHYNIMNLTARISELRTLGWVVDCETKWDDEGNRYGAFTLGGRS